MYFSKEWHDPGKESYTACDIFYFVNVDVTFNAYKGMIIGIFIFSICILYKVITRI